MASTSTGYSAHEPTRTQVATGDRWGPEELAGMLVLDTTDEGSLPFNGPSLATGRGRRPAAARVRRITGSPGRIRLDPPVHTREDDENQELYARVGYVEYDRRPIESFHIVFMRKQFAGA
jgi:hypothetical protein